MCMDMCFVCVLDIMSRAMIVYMYLTLVLPVCVCVCVSLCVVYECNDHHRIHAQGEGHISVQKASCMCKNPYKKEPSLFVRLCGRHGNSSLEFAQSTCFMEENRGRYNIEDDDVPSEQRRRRRRSPNVDDHDFHNKTERSKDIILTSVVALCQNQL